MGRSRATSGCVGAILFADGTRNDGAQFTAALLSSTSSDVLCASGANKYATVITLSASSRRRFVRRASATAGTPLLLGADFRVIDNDNVVYMGLDGTISASRTSPSIMQIVSSIMISSTTFS